ncbi:hypothetical protein ACROYT_G002370 [Oculina patagonica]
MASDLSPTFIRQFCKRNSQFYREALGNGNLSRDYGRIMYGRIMFQNPGSTHCTEFGCKKQILTNRLNNLAEKDEYVPCEGEISTKCEEAVENAWESHSDDLHLFVDYLNCYDKESATCNFPIVQHMNAIVQAIKKHLKEKHGLLGGMLEQIKQ